MAEWPSEEVCDPVNDKADNVIHDFSKYRSASFDQARKVLANRAKSESCWKWIIINLIFTLLFYSGILQKCFESYGHMSNTYAINLDYFLTLLFLWNSLVNLFIYLSPTFKRESVVLSPEQKELLKICDKDKSFTIKDGIFKEKSAPRTTRPIASWPKQRKSSTPSGSILKDTTPERRTTSFTLGSNRDTSFSPNGISLNRSFETFSPASTFMKPSNSASNLSGLRGSPGCSPVGNHDDQITNASSLHRYLKIQEEKDAIFRKAQFDSSRNATQSFWNYGRSALDFLPNFGIYQLATRSQSQNQANEDISSSFDYELILKKLNVGRADIDNWIGNLRKWIAETILEKLVAEIKTINNILTQNGCSELIIGTVSVNTLRNVAISKSQLVPTLQSVIQYLDITTNQEYLIKRIEELATGGCLRLYKWDSGGMYKGKAWDQELPSDAQIIAHLFCTYLDTHLPSNPRYQHGFTGLHFLKPPCKPSDRKCDICILQTRTYPPHFQVVEVDDTHEIPPGRHNLFIAVAVFLFLIKTEKHGMLERVNLGPSGMNILWILNK